MNKPPEPKKPFKRLADEAFRKQKRTEGRKEAVRYALILLSVAILPAILPTLQLSDLPEPAPAPKSPHSAEQPEYENTPAEPSEGLVHLVISQDR